ncbi:hypothetical protein OIO90_003284 [Microbotryomycetes sp. JL221]|nr:hypothetical protein OIO90_003284 [Microbotryomycetes sp. JL221]
MIDTTERLTNLRMLLAKHNLTAYIVESGDAHSSEYVCDADKRRAYISGFTGSAGTAIITDRAAWLTTDGRYHQQAAKELCAAWTLVKHGLKDVKSWQEQIADLPENSRIGLDPRLISVGDYNSLKSTLSKGSSLVPLETNLIDQIWTDKPKRPANPVQVLDEKYAGKSLKAKLEEIRSELTEPKVTSSAGKTANKKSKDHTTWGMVVGLLDEICWTLNIRGSDIAFNPVMFAYLVIPRTPEAPTLFIDIEQLPQTTYEYLSHNNIKIEPYDDVYKYTAGVGERLQPNEKVLLPSKTNVALALAVGDEEKVDTSGRGPIADLKAIKNDVEIEGFRQSHLRDGAALVRYFAWLEQQLNDGIEIKEHDAALKLEEIRSRMDLFQGLSFETISSTGANASVIHYAPDSQTSAVIDRNAIYLCDSGVQCLDGTTDTTRTLHFGMPSKEERRAYTRVLQGHIAVDSAIFPESTSGYQLDPWARKALWLDGLDYKHGTGHGVGHFLNVHEGPAGLGTRVAYNEVKLKPGHVLSNEPGYYEDGKFGIRIENVVVVRPTDLPDFGGTKFYKFEHVTMVPISTNLVDASLLNDQELSWLNEYNGEVLHKLSSLLKSGEDDQAIAWLKKETQPLSR